MTALFPLLLVWAVGATSAEQHLGRADCRIVLDPVDVTLSGEVRLTLSIEGPIPVEVDVPQPLTSSPDWRARSDSPKTTTLPNGRERWQQSFYLEPFRTGDVSLPLQPLRYRTGYEVRDWQLVWPPSSIHVTSSVKDVELGSARPVTDIDRFSHIERPSRPWEYIVGTIVIVLILCAIVILLVRRRDSRPSVQMTPGERAMKALGEIEQNGGPSLSQLPLIADVLRRYLEERFQVAATRQTTAEFHNALLQTSVLTDKQIDQITHILAQCDLVKFAAADLDATACQAILQHTTVLVTETDRNGKTFSPA
jgi:hypothetical protein